MCRVLPILFNSDMVRAILDGRKTVTRRVVKQPVWEDFVCEGGAVIHYLDKRADELKSPVYKAPYQVGDILYVRETWNFAYDMDDGDKIMEGTGRYIYYADDAMPFSHWVDTDTGERKDKMPWRPSIHMPKEAARIWLNVTDVRVERLQEITADEAVREGCGGYLTETKFRVSPICHFMEIWNSTIKKADIATYGWDANPWVWVIEFERCGKPESEG